MCKCICGFHSLFRESFTTTIQQTYAWSKCSQSAVSYTDRNILADFLQVVICYGLGSKDLAWKMGEKCLAGELLCIKTILLVVSKLFAKFLNQYLFQVKQF